MIEVPPEFSFDRIIAPVVLAEFLSEYFEQRTLLVSRNRRDYYESILSIPLLECFLGEHSVKHDQVSVIDADRDISSTEYVGSNGRISLDRLYNLFAGGSTIVLHHMQDSLLGLANLCRGAEQVFNCRFQTNVYFSPPGGQGFKPHYDTHDVFVLQIAGSKEWRLYAGTVPLPLPGEDFDQESFQPGEVSESFVLEGGDLFYCPRGMPHDARATSEPSLHITFGAMVRTWTEVMLEAMAAVCLDLPAFRTSLPPGFATGKADPNLLASKFQDLVAQFAKNAQPGPVIERFSEEFVNSCRALVPDQLSQLISLDRLDLNSRVGGRPGLIYRCEERDGQFALSCHGTQITLPPHASAAALYALNTPEFVIADLPGGLDDAGKLVLVRRLIREGLVVNL